MARLVVSEFVSLDGVMQAPGPVDEVDFAGWTMPYWCEEIGAFKAEELFGGGALLLGRVTYEGFAEAWPSRSGDEFSDRMNSIEKYVVTSTLTAFSWNNARRLDGDVATGVKALKERDDGDVLVAGSAMLVQELLRHGLVDELRLQVYPVVLGRGTRLLDGVDTTLRLVESTATSTGVLLNRYAPAA